MGGSSGGDGGTTGGLQGGDLDWIWRVEIQWPCGSRLVAGAKINTRLVVCSRLAEVGGQIRVGLKFGRALASGSF